jgi:hypothetical protein
MRRFGLVNKDVGGFFSNFFVALNLAMDGEKDGLIPYIVLDNTVFTRHSDYKGDSNSWNWWFDQEIPNSEDSVVRLEYVNDRNFIYFPPPFYYNVVPTSEVFSKRWNRSEIDIGRNYFKKYFKIKDHILQKTEEFYSNNLKNKVSLGIMARGVEFNVMHPQYGNQTVYDYINSTKKILSQHPEIDRIFLVTEDGGYIYPFKKEFNNLVVMNVFRRINQPLAYCQTNWEWPYQYKARPNHTKILGDECLTQALLLGKCDYLLCKENGISAGALFFNENLKNVYYV